MFSFNSVRLCSLSQGVSVPEKHIFSRGGVFCYRFLSQICEYHLAEGRTGRVWGRGSQTDVTKPGRRLPEEKRSDSPSWGAAETHLHLRDWAQQLGGGVSAACEGAPRSEKNFPIKLQIYSETWFMYGWRLSVDFTGERSGVVIAIVVLIIGGLAFVLIVLLPALMECLFGLRGYLVKGGKGHLYDRV